MYPSGLPLQDSCLHHIAVFIFLHAAVMQATPAKGKTAKAAAEPNVVQVETLAVMLAC